MGQLRSPAPLRSSGNHCLRFINAAAQSGNLPWSGNGLLSNVMLRPIGGPLGTAAPSAGWKLDLAGAHQLAATGREAVEEPDEHDHYAHEHYADELDDEEPSSEVVDLLTDGTRGAAEYLRNGFDLQSGRPQEDP